MKTRDFSDIKESTEKIRDAVKLNRTNIKDYSMQNTVEVLWRYSAWATKQHLAKLTIGNESFVAPMQTYSQLIHRFVSGIGNDEKLPRMQDHAYSLECQSKITFSSIAVNEDCLLQRVVAVTIDSKTAMIDLEELMKAIRYA